MEEDKLKREEEKRGNMLIKRIICYNVALAHLLTLY